MREKINSSLTGRGFRSVSHLFCKHVVPLLSVLDLHTNSNRKAHGTALLLNDNNGRSEGSIVNTRLINVFRTTRFSNVSFIMAVASMRRDEPIGPSS